MAERYRREARIPRACRDTGVVVQAVACVDNNRDESTIFPKFMLVLVAVGRSGSETEEECRCNCQKQLRWVRDNSRDEVALLVANCAVLVWSKNNIKYKTCFACLVKVTFLIDHDVDVLFINEFDSESTIVVWGVV